MPILRFAPSPTGLLHLGHVASALFTWDQAAALGGAALLRIEDIDITRCRPEFTEAIFQDLAWLGLDWPRPVRVQSAHMADYAAALARLRRIGVLYPCFCTRAEIAAEIAAAGGAPHGPDGPLYPGTCRTLTDAERRRRLAGGAAAWRLDVAAALAVTGPLTWREGDVEIRARPEMLGDAVLARRDIGTAYHLSVVVDDHIQGITHVTRGQDLFHASHLHRLLQALLGYAAPVWRHHGLVLDAAGQRLSKRDGAMGIAQLRAAGHGPDAVRAMAAVGPVDPATRL